MYRTMLCRTFPNMTQYQEDFAAVQDIKKEEARRYFLSDNMAFNALDKDPTSPWPF